MNSSEHQGRPAEPLVSGPDTLGSAIFRAAGVFWFLAGADRRRCRRSCGWVSCRCCSNLGKSAPDADAAMEPAPHQARRIRAALSASIDHRRDRCRMAGARSSTAVAAGLRGLSSATSARHNARGILRNHELDARHASVRSCGRQRADHSLPRCDAAGGRAVGCGGSPLHADTWRSAARWLASCSEPRASC